MAEDIDISRIKVLKSSAEAIRYRPHVYLQGASNVRNELLLEALCLSLAEAHCGTCSRIDVEFCGRSACVRDNGIGLSLEDDGFGRPFAEVIFTELHSCRDHKAHQELGRKLCGAGIVVTNALSEKFVVDIHTGDVHYRQSYHGGEPDGPFSVVGKTDRTGTELRFTIAEEFAGRDQIDGDALVEDIRQRDVGLSRGKLTIRRLGPQGELREEWSVPR
ncbi:MAG: hypothetical protein GY722_22025 [bacterium]|nr:hypothetical protein [bacterium]